MRDQGETLIQQTWSIGKTAGMTARMRLQPASPSGFDWLCITNNGAQRRSHTQSTCRSTVVTWGRRFEDNALAKPAALAGATQPGGNEMVAALSSIEKS